MYQNPPCVRTEISVIYIKLAKSGLYEQIIFFISSNHILDTGEVSHSFLDGE